MLGIPRLPAVTETEAVDGDHHVDDGDDEYQDELNDEDDDDDGRTDLRFTWGTGREREDT